MGPQPPPVIGRQRDQLVFDGHDEDAAVGHRRAAAHRRRRRLAVQITLPVGRIERQHLGVAGRYVETALPEGDAAAERVAVIARRLEIDLPDLVAGRGVVGADLGRRRPSRRPVRRRRPAGTGPAYSATSRRRCWSSRPGSAGTAAPDAASRGSDSRRARASPELTAGFGRVIAILASFGIGLELRDRG